MTYQLSPETWPFLALAFNGSCQDYLPLLLPHGAPSSHTATQALGGVGEGYSGGPGP